MERAGVRTLGKAERGRVGDDEITLSSELWQIIIRQLGDHTGPDGPSKTSEPDRIPLALQVPEGLSRSSGRKHRTHASIVCWASRETHKPHPLPNGSPFGPPGSKGKGKQRETIYISATEGFRSQFPAVLGPDKNSVSLTPVEPVQLASVFLRAHDEQSYAYACEDEQRFLETLSAGQRILRQGSTLLVNKPLSHKPQVNGHLHNAAINGHSHGTGPIDEPVLRYTVIMAEPVLQGYIQPEVCQITLTPPGTSSDVEVEGLHTAETSKTRPTFDVNEDFLAASLLDDPDEAAFGSLVRVAAPSEQSQPSQSAILSGRKVKPIPLDVRPPLDEIHEDNSEDTELQIFVTSAEIARYGFFSGDYVEVINLETRDCRLVRIHAVNGVFQPTLEPSIRVSPTLLWNLGNPTYLHLRSPKVVSESRGQPLDSSVFPTSQEVSVARIPSEFSMHRRFQPIFLEALKVYFQERRRILKMGDIVALPINASLARYLPASEQSPEEEPNVDDPFVLPLSAGPPSAVVYFKIAALRTGATESGHFYGAHVDPQSTVMIQTGLVQSLVPDVDSYLGIENETIHRHDQAEDNSTMSALLGRMSDFVTASMRPQSHNLGLSITVLLKGARGSGKTTLVRSAAKHAGFHIIEYDCYELVGESDTKTEGNLLARFDLACETAPCILLLKHLEALARKSQVVETGQEPSVTAALQECLRNAQEAWQSSGFPVIVVATTVDVDKIPLSILGLFKEELSIEAPNEKERLEMLQTILKDDLIAPDVSLKQLAIQTAALVADDLVDLAERARRAAVARLDELGIDLSRSKLSGFALTASDFAKSIDEARSSYSESIGAPKIPNVTWDDVGGLANVKTEILDTIQLPLEHPELFSDGLKKRSGVLLYGPPGTGKTLLAKAVATSCSLNFFSVKGPELLNMYIGESEANVRRVFQRARDAKPCVIFFDELDSVAPKRGNQGDSGGVMDRIVSQLLAELDGMSEGKGGSDVFVIGATNRPDLLDPALLRPGRFDRMLYLGVSDTHSAQLKIIEALTRKFKLDPEIDLSAIADACPLNYTGADFYALCSDAMLKAMTRKAEEVDARISDLNARPEYKHSKLTPQYYLAELATPEEINVVVQQGDFERALAELVPSVSEAEMEHYKIVQQRFSSSTIGSSQAQSTDRKGKGKAVEQS